MNTYSQRVSLALVGNFNVGKSSLLRRWLTGDFSAERVVTKGVDTFDKEVSIDGERVLVSVTDTAGQEQAGGTASLTNSYYRKKQAFFVVFDITDKTSFASVAQWVANVRAVNANAHICVVGNKLDLDARRKVDETRACEQLERLGISASMYRECSAKMDTAVHVTFERLVQQVLLDPPDLDAQSTSHLVDIERQPSASGVGKKQKSGACACGGSSSSSASSSASTSSLGVGKRQRALTGGGAPDRPSGVHSQASIALPTPPPQSHHELRKSRSDRNIHNTGGGGGGGGGGAQPSSTDKQPPASRDSQGSGIIISIEGAEQQRAQSTSGSQNRLKRSLSDSRSLTRHLSTSGNNNNNNNNNNGSINANNDDKGKRKDASQPQSQQPQQPQPQPQSPRATPAPASGENSRRTSRSNSRHGSRQGSRRGSKESLTATGSSSTQQVPSPATPLLSGSQEVPVRQSSVADVLSSSSGCTAALAAAVADETVRDKDKDKDKEHRRHHHHHKKGKREKKHSSGKTPRGSSTASVAASASASAAGGVADDSGAEASATTSASPTTPTPATAASTPTPVPSTPSSNDARLAASSSPKVSPKSSSPLTPPTLLTAGIVGESTAHRSVAQSFSRIPGAQLKVKCYYGNSFCYIKLTERVTVDEIVTLLKAKFKLDDCELQYERFSLNDSSLGQLHRIQNDEQLADAIFYMGKFLTLHLRSLSTPASRLARELSGTDMLSSSVEQSPGNRSAAGVAASRSTSNGSSNGSGSGGASDGAASTGPNVGDEWLINSGELEFHKILGKGYFGEVHKASWSGGLCAVKKIFRASFKDKNDVELFNKEVELLARVRHPRVLLFLGVCLDPDHACIVTEFMANGSLYDVLHASDKDATSRPAIVGNKPLTLKIAADIALGMSYLHSRRPPIVHRDLTSRNILLDAEMCAKIADLGLSRAMDDRGMSNTMGCIHLMPPEVFKGNPFSPSADVYSFSIIMWELHCGNDPLPADWTPLKMANEAKDNGYRPPLDDLFGGLGRSSSSRSSEAAGWGQVDENYTALSDLDPAEQYAQRWRLLIEECWDENPHFRPLFTDVVKTLKTIGEKTLDGDGKRVLDLSQVTRAATTTAGGTAGGGDSIDNAGTLVGPYDGSTVNSIDIGAYGDDDADTTTATSPSIKIGAASLSSAGATTSNASSENVAGAYLDDDAPVEIDENVEGAYL